MNCSVSGQGGTPDYFAPEAGLHQMYMESIWGIGGRSGFELSQMLASRIYLYKHFDDNYC